MFHFGSVPLACQMDPEEGLSLIRGHYRDERASMRESCCRGFFTALSLIGSVIGISSLVYFIYVDYDPRAPVNWQGIVALIVSVLSVTVLFVLLDNCCCSSNRRRRTFAAVPIPVASVEELNVAIRRSHSERELAEAVERENLKNLTRSLPPYILLSTDQIQSATSSMDLFLSAESRQTDSKEASTETVVKAPVTTAAPIQTPSITISEVESLPRESDGDSSKTPATETEEQSATDVPSNTTDEEGVRQRKVTPPEEQKYEPVQEKTD